MRVKTPAPRPSPPEVERAPVANDELEALIEEARRRARRRRAGYAAVVALAALLAGSLVVAFGGGGGRATSHPSARARPSGQQGATAPGTPGGDPWNFYETDVMPAGGVQLASARVGFALSAEPTNGFDGNLASPRGLVIAWPSPSVVVTRDGAHHWSRALAIPGGFWGLDVLDANDVWAVGVKALYRSVDGGTSWQRAGEPLKPLVRVAFTTPTSGFGLTVNGRLLETGDSGESWTDSSWHGRGVALCAANAGAILVAEENGAIWRSVNGASRFIRVAPGFAPSRPGGYVGWPTQLSCQGGNAVEFSQSFCEAACGGGLFTRVRQTTDNGRAWRPIAIQVISAAPTVSRPASTPNALLEAAAVGARAVCLVGGYQDGQPPGIGIGCTHAGMTGFRKGTIPTLPFAGRPDNVVVEGADFLNAHTGWLMLDSSIGHNPGGPNRDRAKTAILTTHNGGLTWQRAYVSPTYPTITCPGPEHNTICGWRNPLR